MIEVRHLNKTYDRGSRNANHVLRDLSFTLEDTGFVCIVGESGCGKTSLLNAVGGLDRFDNGTISTERMSVARYGSREMEHERNNSFGYIFQNYYLLNEHSVAYNVYLGLHALKLSHREKLQRVKEALQAVNMERYARRTVSDLSGGQQQRVAIARAFARRPRVIFADEPTGNLDEENTVNICSILRRISKTSLVIMVTHEARIARFFADRIITLSEGTIQEDSRSWQREGLSTEGDSTIYRGDQEETTLEAEGLRLHLLRQPGAEPAELTVAVLNDRVVIKVADGRAVTCTRPEEAPVIKPGKRPVLTLESVDNAPQESSSFREEAPAQAEKAGKGLTFGMMLREALNLLRGRGKGVRRLSAWAFLTAMAVVTNLIVGDYLTVSSVDPHDFVKTDSHILKLQIERGPELSMKTSGIRAVMPQVREYLDDSGLEFTYIPNVSGQLFCEVETFIQMDGIVEGLSAFSYASLDKISESDLIYGRMPENKSEVVVDRWVLEAFLAQDGVVQNYISDFSQMLGAQLSYRQKSYAPVIVGICDRGDPTLYMTDSALISVGVAGYHVMSLSELRGQFAGDMLTYNGQKLEDIVLAEDECVVNINVAGQVYKSQIGRTYGSVATGVFKVTDVLDWDEVDAAIIVADEAMEEIMADMINVSADFSIYCEDKAAMKAYLNKGLPEELEGQILMEVKDQNGDAWARYRQASMLKADARTIVTVTIVALCMVMLYLLQRSCVQGRIGMMAVYRLLGIPGRKLSGIFAMESLLLTLLSVLPATVMTWLTVQVLNFLPSLEFSMVLTWQAAGLVFVCAAVYYLLVSLMPVWSLLRLPPARLAGKYDM